MHTNAHTYSIIYTNHAQTIIEVIWNQWKFMLQLNRSCIAYSTAVLDTEGSSQVGSVVLK